MVQMDIREAGQEAEELGQVTRSTAEPSAVAVRQSH